MTSHKARVAPPMALGFTLALAAFVAALWLGEWRWSLVGVAVLLAGAAWSAVGEREQ